MQCLPRLYEIVTFLFSVVFLTNVGTNSYKAWSPLLLFRNSLQPTSIQWTIPIIAWHHVKYTWMSHIFNFSHSGLTCPHAISYFILHLHCPFVNKGTVVTEYYFILLDTNMVPITYYLIIKNKESGIAESGTGMRNPKCGIRNCRIRNLNAESGRVKRGIWDKTRNWKKYGRENFTILLYYSKTELLLIKSLIVKYDSWGSDEE